MIHLPHQCCTKPSKLLPLANDSEVVRLGGEVSRLLSPVSLCETPATCASIRTAGKNSLAPLASRQSFRQKAGLLVSAAIRNLNYPNAFLPRLSSFFHCALNCIRADSRRWRWRSTIRPATKAARTLVDWSRNSRMCRSARTAS
jgi:hypothetical protein